MAVGHVVLACGEDALAASMKQEPLNMGDLVSVIRNLLPLRRRQRSMLLDRWKCQRDGVRVNI